MGIDAIVFDIDGTLVDSSYQHLVAWSRAFDQVGVTVELWRLHEHIGMGGDQLVAAVAGDEVERDHGDELRDRWSDEYGRLLDEVRPLAGARALLTATAARGCSVVLATSGKPAHTRRALSLLGLDEDSCPMVTSAEVGATKPAPDLVTSAIEKVGASAALVVGDTVWDVQAALRADAVAVGLRTGGISEQVLREAGAADVYAGPAALLADLDAVLAGRPRPAREI